MTDLGVLGAGRLGAVDRSGTVRPVGADWSLGWWIGAEDRWHVPPVEAAVRQTQVGDTPVVETRVRVAGGDVVHHAYAVTGPGGAAALVVEITNETPVPVAVALVVDGAGLVADDTRLRIGDRHTLRLPRSPSQVVGPAAFVPLPHKATLRVALVVGDQCPDPDELPSADRVATGWRTQADAGARWSLPEPTITAATDTARGFLLLQEPTPGWEEALVAEARHALGPADPDVRREVVDRQRLSGAFRDVTGSEAATGQALVALGVDPHPELDAVVAKAAHAVERRRRVRRDRKDPRRAGLLPAGPQPPVLGADGRTYLDDWWSVAGLSRAARLLEGGDQLEAAVDAWRFARGLAADVDTSIAAVTAALDVEAIPAGPDRPLDAGVVGIVVAAALGAVDAGSPSVAASLDLVRAELTTADGMVTAGVLSDGWSPWLTALLAKVEIGLGERRGLDRLQTLAKAANGRGSWPELVDGEPRVPVRLAEHHAAAGAAFVLATRTLLVAERGPRLERADTLAILPVFAEEWRGQGIELHDAPTDLGSFGFAVRWHGERPALLWELTPDVAERPFRLVAPGLDPDWSSTEAKGEALLAAPPGGVPTGPAVEPVEATAEPEPADRMPPAAPRAPDPPTGGYDEGSFS